MTGAGAVENTANVQAGDSVAIFGVGGVGLSAVVAARARGAPGLRGAVQVQEGPHERGPARGDARGPAGVILGFLRLLVITSF